MTSFRVRPLTPDDVAAYTALRREMLDDAPWAFASSPEDDAGLDGAAVRARMGQPGYAIVGAWEEGARGRLVGAAGLVRHRHAKMAHRAQIWGVYTTPGARGRGVGTAVVAGVMDVARGWPGVTSVGLSVSARAEGAQRLYHRLGFVPWGTEPGALAVNGRAYDEVHMVAPLRTTPR